MLFLSSSWKFLRSNKLEQLEFKLEKILVLRKMQEKLENGLDQDFAKKDVNLTLKRCRKIPQKRHSAFGPTNNKR